MFSHFCQTLGFTHLIPTNYSPITHSSPVHWHFHWHYSTKNRQANLSRSNLNYQPVSNTRHTSADAACRRVHRAGVSSRMNSIAVDFPPSLECNLAAFEDIQGGLLCFRLVNRAEIEHLAAVSVSFHWQQ